MVKIEAPLLTTYFVRHQESVQNKQGFGPSDTDLTEEGKQNVRDIVKLFNHVGVDNIDYIFCGDLKRHDQTLNALLDQIDFKGHIRFDEKLNAFFNHPMLEGDPEKTEKEYDLARFKRGDNGLYEIRLSDNKTLGFDPQGTGVYPFDPLYSWAYFDKDIRQAVFPDVQDLATFDEVERKVKMFQASLIHEIKPARPQNVVAISSCSPSGYNLEYSAFETIGENLFVSLGSENNSIFYQKHDELMILGYSREDYLQNNDKLRVIEGNIKIKNFINRT